MQSAPQAIHSGRDRSASVLAVLSRTIADSEIEQRIEALEQGSQRRAVRAVRAQPSPIDAGDALRALLVRPGEFCGAREADPGAERRHAATSASTSCMKPRYIVLTARRAVALTVRDTLTTCATPRGESTLRRVRHRCRVSLHVHNRRRRGGNSGCHWGYCCLPARVLRTSMPQ